MSEQPINVWRVNAFTARRFSGNPAGVVPDADGLPDDLMLAIAGELNDISETVYICRPETKDADIRLRYFTSKTEVDLCGHATVSALFTLAWLNRINGTNATKTIRAETRVGVLDLGVQFVDGKPAWASMEQVPAQMHEAPRADLVPGILGLPISALSDQLKIGCASTGLWACFVPLKDQSFLEKVRIDSDNIAQIWPDNPELTGVYPFVLKDQNTTQGRFFSPPQFGIVEDPVTGTACGALGAYLMAQGYIPPAGELLARQGFEMGRGGQVRVCRNANGKMIIYGQAVAVMRGEIVPSVTMAEKPGEL
jgi:PhzF family phenazine biosynthesis protein